MTVLPKTLSELTAFLAHGGGTCRSSRAMQAAELLELHDVIDECGICGTDVVKTAAFASAAVAHYALAGEQAVQAAIELEDLVRASGAETGSGPDPTCARHARDGATT